MTVDLTNKEKTMIKVDDIVRCTISGFIGLVVSIKDDYALVKFEEYKDLVCVNLIDLQSLEGM